MMRGTAGTPHERLISKLDSIAELSDDDRVALRRLPLQFKRLRNHSDIVREGDRPSQCCLVVSGLMQRYKTLSGGGRVIVGLHVPGDLPDLQSLYLSRLDHTLATVTDCEAAMVSHTALREVSAAYPRVGIAMWREALIQAAVFRQWIVMLGGLPARERLGHLICELHDRLSAVGLVENETFALPITQSELGEATGMTGVHVNRSLQDLRARKLLSFDGGLLRILNWPALKALAKYEPDYLQQNPPSM